MSKEKEDYRMGPDEDYESVQEEKWPFEVGQKVEVSYRANVAEVISGSSPRTAPALRVTPLEGADPLSRWVSPVDGITIRILSHPIPTSPGLYWQNDEPDLQSEMGAYHTDGLAFHYLNASGNWVDMGWGNPHNRAPLNRMDSVPFQKPGPTTP